MQCTYCIVGIFRGVKFSCFTHEISKSVLYIVQARIDHAASMKIFPHEIYPLYSITLRSYYSKEYIRNYRYKKWTSVSIRTHILQEYMTLDYVNQVGNSLTQRVCSVYKGELLIGIVQRPLLGRRFCSSRNSIFNHKVGHCLSWHTQKHIQFSLANVAK